MNDSHCARLLADISAWWLTPMGLAKSGEWRATALDPAALAHGGDRYAGTYYAVLAASP
jgi:hypothetical protein